MGRQKMITRAKATISGGPHYPNINGEIYFTQINYYVEIVVRIYRLPSFSREDGKTVGPFGFHLHTGQSCEKRHKGKSTFPKRESIIIRTISRMATTPAIFLS